MYATGTDGTDGINKTLGMKIHGKSMYKCDCQTWKHYEVRINTYYNYA